jgi:hypothetical protein
VIVPAVPVMTVKVVVEEASATNAVAAMVFVLVVLAVQVGDRIGNFEER